MSALLMSRRAGSLLASFSAGALGAAAFRTAWPDEGSSALAVAHAEEGPQPSGALHPKEWRAFAVQSKERMTHNTQRIRFELPDPQQTIGLHVASCLLTKADIGSEKEDGSRKPVIRPYTPTSRPEAKGHFDLVIKEYPDGKMSRHITGLQVGDKLECKGPMSKLAYSANMKRSIGMIAGGTGITPMLQVASEVLENPDDKTEVSLLYASQTEGDIILRKQIDQMAREHRNFKVYYVVDKGGWLWRGGVGHITPELIQKHLPGPAADSLVLVCGPPGLMKAISGDKAQDKSQGPLEGALKQLGYTEEGVYKF